MSRRGGGKTQLSKQKELFALLKKELGKGNLEGSRNILKELEASCMDYNENLLSIIEVGNKAPVPPQERFIEYMEGTSRTKLTVNPRTGRMTLKVARSGYAIVFLSGRDEVCRKITEDWLSVHFEYDYDLFMRPEGSKDKDTIVKEALYRENVHDFYNVEAVIDDRKSVVKECWMKLGIPVIAVGRIYDDF
jgi:hypothetical protein